MTNAPLPDDLFSPDSFAAGGLDLNTAYREFSASPMPRPKNSFRVYQTNDPKIVRSELIVRSLDAGIDLEWGEIDRDSNSFYSSTLDTSVPGYATIPQGIGTDTVWERAAPVASTTVFNTLMLGAGATANKSVYSAHVVGGVHSSVGLSAVTYTPPSQIVSMSRIITGSANNPVQLAIGHASDPVRVQSDTIGTSVGIMHANTTGCYGIAISPINANGPRTLLIYANNNIYTLGIDQAIGTAPTSATSGVPNGGYFVGFLSLGSQKGSFRSPVRAYWVFPEANQSTSMYGTASSITIARANIWSTNLEGSDPQPLVTSLDNVTFAVAHRGALYATDGVRCIKYDQGEEDMGWARLSRQLPSATGRRIAGFYTGGGELHAIAIGDNTSGIALFKADTERRLWHQVSASMAVNDFASVSDVGTYPYAYAVNCWPIGPAPFDEKNRYLHLLPLASATTGKSYAKYLEPLGHSGYDWFSRIDDDLDVEASGVVTSAKLAFPGVLAGRPAVVEEVRYLRDSSAAAGFDLTGATWKIEIASQGTAGLTFSTRNYKYTAGDKMSKAGRRWASEKDAITRLQWRVTLTRSTGRRTPNALPFAIRMLHFLDGNVKSPQACGPNAWGVEG